MTARLWLSILLSLLWILATSSKCWNLSFKYRNTFAGKIFPATRSNKKIIDYLARKLFEGISPWRTLFYSKTSIFDCEYYRDWFLFCMSPFLEMNSFWLILFCVLFLWLPQMECSQCSYLHYYCHLIICYFMSLFGWFSDEKLPVSLNYCHDQVSGS